MVTSYVAVVEGYNEIPLTLFEAEAAVDSELFYLTDILHYNGSELFDELRSIMAEHIIKMCYEFVLSLSSNSY